MQQGKKLTGGGEPGFFGWGVALSGEGNTALIGEGFAGGPKEVLEESVGVGPYEQVGLSLTASQAGEEPVEANAGVERGALSCLRAGASARR